MAAVAESYESFYSRFRTRIDRAALVLCVLVPWTNMTYNVLQLSICKPQDTRIRAAFMIRSDPILSSFPCSDGALVPGGPWFAQSTEQVQWLAARLPWAWAYTLNRYMLLEVLPGMLNVALIVVCPLLLPKLWRNGGRSVCISILRLMITVWLSMEHFDWDMTSCGVIVPGRLHKFQMFNMVWRAVLYGLHWQWHAPVALVEAVLSSLMAHRAAPGAQGWADPTMRAVVQGALAGLLVSLGFSYIEATILHPMYAMHCRNFTHHPHTSTFTTGRAPSHATPHSHPPPTTAPSAPALRIPLLHAAASPPRALHPPGAAPPLGHRFLLHAAHPLLSVSDSGGGILGSMGGELGGAGMGGLGGELGGGGGSGTLAALVSLLEAWVGVHEQMARVVVSVLHMGLMTAAVLLLFMDTDNMVRKLGI